MCYLVSVGQSPQAKGKAMGMSFTRWVDEKLALNQYEYLGIELRVMEEYPPEHVAQVLKFDARYQRLMLEEQRLLKLREEATKGGLIEYAEPKCRLRGYRWELRKKYRGRIDGAKQPNKKRLSRFRNQRRNQDKFAALVN